MRPTLMRDSFYPLGDDISIFFQARCSKPTQRTAKEKAGGRAEPPGPPAVAQIEFWPAETQIGNYL